MKKILVSGSLLLSLTACGSFQTLVYDDDRIARQLRRANTNCTDLFRVYSGVAYNLCVINNKNTGVVFPPLVLLYLSDAIISAVIDTVAIPYTAYQQNEQGSIEIR